MDSLDALLACCTRNAVEIIGARQGVSSITSGRGWTQAVASVGFDGTCRQWQQSTTPPDGSGIEALVCETNTALRLTPAELEAHPRWRGPGVHGAEHLPLPELPGLTARARYLPGAADQTSRRRLRAPGPGGRLGRRRPRRRRRARPALRLAHGQLRTGLKTVALRSSDARHTGAGRASVTPSPSRYWERRSLPCTVTRPHSVPAVRRDVEASDAGRVTTRGGPHAPHCVAGGGAVHGHRAHEQGRGLVTGSAPVTLLAGPSTSLRDDLLRCLVLRRPGLVAIAYDVEPGGVRRRTLDCSGEHHREHLRACCLSCVVREDAGRAVALVQGAGRWREVVLALPAPLSPSHVDADLHLDTVTTVVDARLLLAHVTGDDLLAERGLAAADTDRRSTAELVVRQLEDADVLAVVDQDRLDTGTARTVESLLAHLAPLAVQVPLGPGGTGCDDVVSTGRRHPDVSVDQRLQLAALAVDLCAPSCDVATVRWDRDRPLHSGRLAAALPQLLAGVVRSRGHMWLADRLDHRLRWESAGGSLSLGDPHVWSAHRSSSLVLTGVGLPAGDLVARLDSCLCDDVELTGPVTWEDPFAGALGPAQVEDTAP